MAIQWTSNYQHTAPSGASGVAITPSGAAWANSPWSEIHSGTDYPWLLTGVVLGDRGAAVQVEIDIGVVPVSGVISGCTVIATQRATYQGDATYGHGFLPLPIPVDNIPSGFRVGARLRKPGTSTTQWTLGIQFLKKPVVGNLETTTQRLRTLPAAADPISLQASTSAWVYGSWVQISPSAPSDMVLAGFGMTNIYNDADFELQIGKGPSGGESALLTVKGNIALNINSPGNHMLPNPRDGINAGDRVVARFRKEGTNPSGTDVFLLYYGKPL